ncbi:MAG: YggT family protein [Deltaproteobacteria bacterium]|nr:YggT family protein [Deltaproteobacteria bacterium]
MFVLGNLIEAIANVLSLILRLYTFVILGAVIVSWVRADPYHPIVRFLRQITEPVFYQVRRFLPKSFFRWGIDFSPLIVLILLEFFGNWILRSLFQLAQKLT